MPKPIPDGYHSITPYIVVKDGQKAIEFYMKAFNAQVRYTMPSHTGKGIAHAEMQFGTSIIMLGEECPEHKSTSAETLGGSPIGLFFYVQDVDASFQQALKAGATEEKPVQEMFWGDRMGSVKDPFGYTWSLATHTRDMTPDEIRAAAEEFYKELSAKQQ